MTRPTVPDRLWRRVEVGQPGECWPWMGATQRSGHGRIGGEGRRTFATHRIAYEDKVGPIPDGLNVLHRCDNPPCCNPAHLFLGTQLENIADMNAKGRQSASRGERHPHSRLTDDQIAEIRRRREAGESTYALGRAFGISPQYVGQIASNRWRKTA